MAHLLGRHPGVPAACISVGLAQGKRSDFRPLAPAGVRRQDRAPEPEVVMRAWIAWSVIVLLTIASPSKAQSWLESLLTPDEAFVMSAHVATPGRLVIRVRVADTYALYRERIEILSTDTFEVSHVDVPRGEVAVDPDLGEIEKLRGEFEITLFGRLAGSAPSVTVKSQGCADAGVCLVPTRRTLYAR
jgi:thiol:disulfide interchange protein